MIGDEELGAADDRWEAQGFPEGLDVPMVRAHSEMIADRLMIELDRECSLTREEEAYVQAAIRTASQTGVAVGVYAGRDECSRARGQE